MSNFNWEEIFGKKSEDNDPIDRLNNLSSFNQDDASSETDRFGNKLDDLSPMDLGATMLFEMFGRLQKAGFKEDQAMQIVVASVTQSINQQG